MRPLEDIVAAIEAAGLAARGALALEAGEQPAGLAAVVLVGVVGTRGWTAFAQSDEARDGRPHPLDRWSRRVIGALAAELGAKAFYPFEGPPYLPFQRWARRAEPVAASPLGTLIHPRYGLSHSYRGALGFTEGLVVPGFAPGASPCDACVERPCLSACPVGAYTADGFDVAACAAHLRAEAGRACMEGGCLARRACPVGREYAQSAPQAAFHIQAFLRARDAEAEGKRALGP